MYNMLICEEGKLLGTLASQSQPIPAADQEAAMREC